MLPVCGHYGLITVLNVFFAVNVCWGWISRFMHLMKKWDVARIGRCFVFCLPLLWAFVRRYNDSVECPFVPPCILFCLVPGGVVTSETISCDPGFIRLGGLLFLRVAVLLFSTLLKNVLLRHSRFGGFWKILSNYLLCSVVVFT